MPNSSKPPSKSVKLPFEKGEIALPIPDGWNVVDTVRPKPHAKVAYLESALMDALDKPIGGHGPLRDRDLRDRRIVICVDDISRPTPTGQFFGTLLDYLLAHGAQREKMKILFALGVHRDMTREEAHAKLGDA